MALVKCPECNKEISDRAISCPHCGLPLKEVKPKENERPDLSKMEVILYRGIKKSLTAQVYLFVVCFVLFIAFGLFFVLMMGGVVGLIIGIISFVFAVLCIPVFVVLLVKIHNNSKFKQECLYYNDSNHTFYLVSWSKEITLIDAHEEIRVGNNAIGLDETVVVHQGRRINLGFSSSNLKIANQRIREIHDSIK